MKMNIVKKLTQAFFLLSIICISECSLNNKIRKLQATTSTPKTDTPKTDKPTGSNSTETEPILPPKKSSGISTGAICAIAIPCIAALLGVAGIAALCKGTAPAMVHTPPTYPQPTFIDSSLDKFNVVQTPPPQTQVNVVQPQPQILAPQPAPQIIRPNYPIRTLEAPKVNRAFQPMYAQSPQIQMVPVQKVEMVPVTQMEMVPVQQVVPIQEVVPVQQAGQAITQVTQVSTMPNVIQTQPQIIQTGIEPITEVIPGNQNII